MEATVEERLAFSRQLTAISYQLSAISYQLSAISYQKKQVPRNLANWTTRNDNVEGSWFS